MRDKSHDGAGEEHSANGKRGDADHVAAQGAERDEPGPIHEQWRQEDDEHQRRIDFNGGQARHEGQQRAARKQRHRWRQPEPVGRVMQRDDRHEHADHQLEQMCWIHRGCILKWLYYDALHYKARFAKTQSLKE